MKASPAYLRAPALDNLSTQRTTDQLAFQKSQTVRLHDPAVRYGANTLLIAKQIPTGCRSDAETFDKTLKDASLFQEIGDNVSKMEWKGDLLQISYLAPDKTYGQAQVNALLTSLRTQDADLTDTLKHAERDAAAAKANVDRLRAQTADIGNQIKIQRQLGQDRPEPDQLTKLETTVASTSILREAAKAATNHATNALQQLRAFDPNAATVPTNDPIVLEFRQQADQLTGEISELKNRAANDNAEATLAEGAKPQTPIDEAVLQKLQSLADSANTQLRARLKVLQFEQAHSPEQIRDMDRPKAIEDLSVKITALQKDEARAISDADTAAVELEAAHRKRDLSDQATNKLTELTNLQISADNELKQASADQQAKDAIVSQSVSIAGDPTISTIQIADQRPVIAGITSGAIVLVICWMIIASSRAAAAGSSPDNSSGNPGRQIEPADSIEENETVST